MTHPQGSNPFVENERLLMRRRMLFSGNDRVLDPPRLLGVGTLVTLRQVLQRIARWDKTMVPVVCYRHATTNG